MSLSYHNIEASLRRTASRLKGLRFLQSTATVGVLITGWMLLLGVAMVREWLTHRGLVQFLVGVGYAAAFVACLTILFRTLSQRPERSRLARVLENAHANFLDRLNTLVALERRKRDDNVRPYFKRIERQAHELVRDQRPKPALPLAQPLLRLALFGVLLAITIGFYDRYLPFSHLRVAVAAQPVETADVVPPELAIPDTAIVEERQNWGEVRITEPGQDVKATKVDAVQLQIEAAANTPLKEVNWATAINGADETPRPLPAPTERKFAAYQPVLYMDELGLSDWDVVTYYAKAATEKGDTHASDVYFLEVRPFREDILKLQAQDGNGKCYSLLNQLTELIQRQQRVIRQTHRHLQNPPSSEHLASQDRKKLADAEQDLSDASAHLYATIATEMENQPIGEVLEHLSKAGTWLDRAVTNLVSNAMPEAQSSERSALTELVATRKNFQKFINENPDALKDDEEPQPEIDRKDLLSQMAEFRNEARAAKEFLDKAVDKQRDIAQRAAVKPRAEYPQLVKEEKELRDSLKEFQAQHPGIFKDLAEEAAEAQKALSDSVEALDKKSAAARTNPQKAATELAELNQALQEKAVDLQLADAYRLKKIIDEKAAQFARLEEKPDSMPQEQIRKAAEEAREATSQLKKVAEQQPSSEAFGPQLAHALSDQNKQMLDAELNRVSQMETPEAKQQAAAACSSGLGKISDAFTQSQPKAAQDIAKADPLGESSEEGFSRSMEQLKSLLNQKQGDRKPSPESEAQQRRDAFYGLNLGLSKESEGSNERGRDLLVLIERELRDRKDPLEIELLKKLIEELQHYSVELKDPSADKPEVELTRIDVSKLPPAYRGRIEKYFQKLSEK